MSLLGSLWMFVNTVYYVYSASSFYWVGLPIPTLTSCLANNYLWQDTSPVTYTNWNGGNPPSNNGRCYGWNMVPNTTVTWNSFGLSQVCTYATTSTAKWDVYWCNEPQSVLCQRSTYVTN